jgi:iron complex outermembrane receptor protein
VDVHNRGGFFGDRSRLDSAFSGYAAVRFTPVPAWTATIQASRGYRDPTLSDRFFRGVSGRGFVVGNPDLDAERSRQFDTSLRWQRGPRSVSVFGYHYRIRDLIERYRAGSDFRFRNRGEAEVKGVELEAATPLPYRFSLHAAATIARGEVLDDNAPLDDIAMPNGHVALRWSHRRAVAFAHAFFFAADNRPGPVETDRSGYTNLDLGLSYRLSPRLVARVVGKNVTDVRHPASADANAALAPGRSISIAIDGSFRGK